MIVGRNKFRTSHLSLKLSSPVSKMSEHKADRPIGIPSKISDPLQLANVGISTNFNFFNRVLFPISTHQQTKSASFMSRKLVISCLQAMDEALALRDALREQIKFLREKLKSSIIQAVHSSNRGIEDSTYIETQKNAKRLLDDMKACVKILFKPILSSILPPLFLSPSRLHISI